ncbi:type I restriction enzyme R subunit [Methanomicrobium sp. W14]|uniref:type I restriction endonuclease subunit R, EcoR124 family n=1 Tax=Methanomicrobium sp. W14 TaxID=2817839 RepID=UPI001AE58D1B|nr:HsdR family type I site-specific deoxyribonuclease [Methanomicrobium sp. W14]MBP2134517.1 type I restriction enzyme R subunit [Methanomicrobium sp. W14]
MTFQTEAEFEEALISALKRKGWGELPVLKYSTEKELIENWKNILLQNNNGIDRLNGYPLTDGEMQQILEQIILLKTPVNLNGFINGKTISVKRDNPDDVAHLGKEISLKIYDRQEIAAGQSTYQIAQQPQFTTPSPILNNRRGDLMLLINGMPVIHLELKRSGIHVSQAYTQIEKYSHENIFTGLFSLIQVFVAMTPEETVYFANPGTDGIFNKDFYFHWADFNNESINDWKDIADSLLSIPMAHQLIGFYTVADESDGNLKVLRSYQYYAANAISDRVAQHHWGESNPLGGYIGHTTGSGKTLTSFKSAQLIATSKDADKVIFLVDRIELGTQSLREYKNFTSENQSVQGTEDTQVLIAKLKSSNPQDTLIVTSIQKMSNISEESSVSKSLIDQLNTKRIVIIVDEAHRSTFGDMRRKIREAFPDALFFGFTGTPIYEENQKKFNTTATLFGNELHRYSIADGIRDKNVLGFDLYKVSTHKDTDVRTAVALYKAKAESIEDVLSDPKKSQKYYYYMDASKVKMAGYEGSDGKYVKGIEDYLPKTQYLRIEHQQKVVEDILENWTRLSRGGKFHAIFATSSINEAIDYYRLIKQTNPDLKITALFDPNIDNTDGFEIKEDGLVEILDDYNKRYQTKFTLKDHHLFKKDISARFAHKEPYTRIQTDPEEQIHLLIVVDQMLTGFDSKWINTVYLDKIQKYEQIIQAFSRTNRLFGPEKPFGIIRYYRKPHTMERNIKEAVKLYSGEKVLGFFVDKLEENINELNKLYTDIETLFENAGISNFITIPDDIPSRRKFAKLFKDLNLRLEAAKLQGFTWKQLTYEFGHGSGKPKTTVNLQFDETIYLILALRYKELFGDAAGGGETADIPFEIDGYLTEINTGAIDVDYMNANFDKYCRSLDQPNLTEEERQTILDELHKSFATLTQEEQKHAEHILHDVERGDLKLESGKTFREYIAQYQAYEKNDQISRISSIFGLNTSLLIEIMTAKVNEANIDEYGRFTELEHSVDKEKARNYFRALEGSNIPDFKINVKIHNLLQDFILHGGYDIEIPENL